MTCVSQSFVTVALVATERDPRRLPAIAATRRWLLARPFARNAGGQRKKPTTPQGVATPTPTSPASRLTTSGATGGRPWWLPDRRICSGSKSVAGLFDYQQQAVDGIRAAYRAGKKAPLFVLPTGGGKTIVLAYIAHHARLRGRRVGIVVHRRELVGQVSEALKAWDCPHGLVTPSAKPSHDAVQVMMAQTLVRRLPLDKSGRYQFDLLITDEAHHVTADSAWGMIHDHNAGALFLGVTATPCRLDGKGLGVSQGGYFDEMVTGPTVAELIERGRLARPVVYQPEKRPDLSGVRKRGGDYKVGELAGAMDKASLTGDAVAHYARVCGGKAAIAFCVTTDHAAHVRDEFTAAGWQAAQLTGTTPDVERRQMLRDLAEGRLQVLTSCNVVSEGTDIPAVSAAILLRPTASFALAMQQMGRALRVHPGKSEAIILDHAGNTLAHGAPDEPVEWRLDGFTRGKRKPMLRPCRVCGSSTFGNGAKACGVCGHVFSVQAESGAEDSQDMLPLAADGELVLLDEGRRQMHRERRAWLHRALAEAKTEAEFTAIAHAMNYRSGWVGHEMRRRNLAQGD